jgi:hypothetical protein
MRLWVAWEAEAPNIERKSKRLQPIKRAATVFALERPHRQRPRAARGQGTAARAIGAAASTVGNGAGDRPEQVSIGIHHTGGAAIASGSRRR